jgi:Protein of unknown function (DUF3300)
MGHARALRTTLSVAVAMLLSVGPIASAQDDSDITAPPVAPATSQTLTDAQLQTLVAPIALYPDPLIAQILPASTYAMQVTLGARWLQANPNPTEAQIEALDAEPSIKAMLHYPTILAMMSAQIDWTQSLGAAFLNQQPDVMTAIQELRVRAQSDGALQSTPQQQVVMDGNDIEILPVDPNLVYVPQYDPNTVYEEDGGTGVYLTFGEGYPEGLWLDNDVDWSNGWVAGGDGWNHGWDDARHGKRPGEARPITKPWERDQAEPLPLHARPPVREAARSVGPGYEDSRAQAPAPSAFQGYQNRVSVQRVDERAQQSRPAPQARAAPRAAPEAFHPQGNGRAVAAQSARGQASRGGGGHAGGGRK